MRKHKQTRQEMRAFGIGNAGRTNQIKVELSKGQLVKPMKMRTPEDVVKDYSDERS